MTPTLLLVVDVVHELPRTFLVDEVLHILKLVLELAADHLFVQASPPDSLEVLQEVLVLGEPL